MERKSRADVVDAESHPTRSKLERTARGVSALYSYMSERKIDTTPTWTAADGPAKEELAVVSFIPLFPRLSPIPNAAAEGIVDVEGMSVRSE